MKNRHRASFSRSMLASGLRASGFPFSRIIQRLDPLVDTAATEVSRNLRKALREVRRSKEADGVRALSFFEGDGGGRIEWERISSFERFKAENALRDAVRKAPAELALRALVELECFIPPDTKDVLEEGWMSGNVEKMAGEGRFALPYLIAKAYRDRSESMSAGIAAVIESICDDRALAHLEVLMRIEPKDDAWKQIQSAARKAHTASVWLCIEKRRQLELLSHPGMPHYP